MGILFTFLLATLFIRPGEIILDLQNVPIFYVLIIGSVLVNLGAFLSELGRTSLVAKPTNLAVLLLMVAVVLSHLVGMRLFETNEAASSFIKTVIFYFALTAAVRTPAQLESLVRWSGYFIIVAVSITVLQYLEYIHLEGMQSVYDSFTNPETHEVERVLRICGTGLFSDPNDLSLVLVLGMGLAVYLFLGGREDRIRPFWLAPLALFVYCLMLTHSRGGFLAMLVGMFVLFQSKYGWKKSIPYILIGLPAAVVLFGGRQTDLSTEGGTGQERIKLWALGFSEMVRQPIFGTGYGTYPDLTGGLVAHNSFVHAFVELGIFGGILFFSAFWYVLYHLYKLKAREEEILEPGLKKLRPCLLAAIAASTVGMMTISRTYIMPTYLLIGMGMSYLWIVDQEVPGAAPPLSLKLLKSATLYSLTFLIVVYTYARFGARFGGG